MLSGLDLLSNSMSDLANQMGATYDWGRKEEEVVTKMIDDCGIVFLAT